MDSQFSWVIPWKARLLTSKKSRVSGAEGSSALGAVIFHFSAHYKQKSPFKSYFSAHPIALRRR